MPRMNKNPLKTWRADHKLSQKQLAKLLEVKAMTLSRWERGDNFPRKKHWMTIEEVTGIAPSDLVGHVRHADAESAQ